MTTETRIGLLVGLMFIIAFGLVLGELSDPNKMSPEGLQEEKAPAQVAMREVAGQRIPRDQMTIAHHLPSLEAVAPVHEEIEAEMSETAGGEGFVESHMVRNEVAPAVVVDAGRSYAVEEGDTLIRIARKVYGSGNEKYYKRIYEANRDVLKNERDIYVGQQLVIPAIEGQPAPAAVASHRQTERRTQPQYSEMTIDEAAQALGRARQKQEIRTYVVQQNDNLTKIARSQLSDGSEVAVRRLFEANRDVLDNPNDLQVGMKLKIPG